MVYCSMNEIYILSICFVKNFFFYKFPESKFCLFFLYNFRIDVTNIPETQPVIKPDSDGFQTVVNRKKKRAFFKNMLTIKQINEEFDRKEREIMEEISCYNFDFTITNFKNMHSSFLITTIWNTKLSN